MTGPGPETATADAAAALFEALVRSIADLSIGPEAIGNSLFVG